MKDPFYTYGSRELQLAGSKGRWGTEQVLDSDYQSVFARKLRKRKDTSLVARSVTKRFLETYCMQGSCRKVSAL
jgi:hypothetical protein